jgi:hypothetical protein
MRFVTTETPNGVSLIFTGDGVVKSVGINSGEVKRKTVDEGIALLISKLVAMVMPVTVDLEYYEIDDEDDADVSLYEEEVVVDGYTPREYLESIGVV